MLDKVPLITVGDLASFVRAVEHSLVARTGFLVVGIYFWLRRLVDLVATGEYRILQVSGTSRLFMYTEGGK